VKKMKHALVLACGLALASASGAWAQGPNEPPRGFVSLGGGYQFGSHSATETGTFQLYEEPGSFNGTREVGTGAFFDVGAGIHISGKLSGGVAFSYFSKGSDTSFTALVPHPLFIGEVRTVALNTTDLGHKESAVHFQVFYQLLSSSKYDASIFAGPSVISVKEDTVDAVAATETGSPYTAVTLNATFGSVSKTAFGANLGMNVNYHLTGAIDAGLLVRYTFASANLPSGDTTRKVTLGGPQAGVALRYRF
jgi:hypothetical protein